jgi:hypothetical protein
MMPLLSLILRSPKRPFRSPSWKALLLSRLNKSQRYQVASTDNAVHDESPCTPVHGLSPKFVIVTQDDSDLDDDEFSLQRNGNTVGGVDLGEKTTDRHKEAVASLVKEPLSVLQKKRSLAFDINCIIVACEFSCTLFW